MSGKLTAFQIKHLSELADARDNGASGEAYWYPHGANEHSTAQLLTRRGLLRGSGFEYGYAYTLTDEGYAAVRAGSEAFAALDESAAGSGRSMP